MFVLVSFIGEYSLFATLISSSNVHVLCDICSAPFNGKFYRIIHTQMA